MVEESDRTYKSPWRSSGIALTMVHARRKRKPGERMFTGHGERAAVASNLRSSPDRFATCLSSRASPVVNSCSATTRGPGTGSRLAWRRSHGRLWMRRLPIRARGWAAADRRAAAGCPTGSTGWRCSAWPRVAASTARSMRLRVRASPSSISRRPCSTSTGRWPGSGGSTWRSCRARWTISACWRPPVTTS